MYTDIYQSRLKPTLKVLKDLKKFQFRNYIQMQHPLVNRTTQIQLKSLIIKLQR